MADSSERAHKRVKVEDEDSSAAAEASTSSLAAVKQEGQPVVKAEEEPVAQGNGHAKLEEEDDEEDPYAQYELDQQSAVPPSGDLYLDTINRTVLDFDFERLCSVSLSNINVYACLVCGKYYQGRGKSSHAYAHSIHDDHHVFINLETLKVYVLPDAYEVNDPSLDDIRFLLSPTFTPKALRNLDAGTQPCYTLSKQVYKPGFIGLNDIRANSYMNVVIQALLHVTPLRDYFIFHSQPPPPPKQKAANGGPVTSSSQSQQGSFAMDNRSELVKRFGMLARKLWNPKSFKSQVSPHEFLQEVASASNKRFKITEEGDPLEFLSWLLNALHRDLGGTKKPNSSIIYSAFQGELRVEDQAINVKSLYDTTAAPKFDIGGDIKSTKSPFLFLAIDLPPMRVFQDATDRNNIIPQVPISAVLAKFDGQTTQESAGRLRRYKLTRLPPFVILHIKRFTSNNFVEEKNPTIVNFPLKGVDFSDYIDRGAAQQKNGGEPNLEDMYDLVANVTHESEAGTAHQGTTWKAHVHTKAQPGSTQEDEWYQIEDLVVEEINKQMVFLGETYIQIWERRLPPNQKSHDLRIDASSANLKQKTTKALAAAQALKNQEAEGTVITQQGPQKIGQYTRGSFKMKRERGDSGMDI